MLLGFAVSAAIVVALVALSPWLLAAIDWLPADRLREASDLGQAYGAVSALLSSAALGGVVVGLVLQRRDMRRAQAHSLRESHDRLIGRAIDDTELSAAWGQFGSQASRARWRQEAYVNLIVSQWQTMFELDALAEPELLENASRLFGGAIARDYWARVSPFRLSTAIGRREKRFHHILQSGHDATAVVAPEDGRMEGGSVAGRPEVRFGRVLLWGAAMGFGLIALRLRIMRRTSST